MSLNIKFREYRNEDAPYLEDIIRKTWEYDRFCSEKIAKDMASLYLRSCLASQSFTRVALKDGKPVGIIMAKNIRKYKRKIKWTMQAVMAMMKIYMKSEGRQVCNVFKEINNLDENLLKERKRNYEGEVVFFAISEKCRGTGIGKQLFNKALDYFKEENIKDFYLYTDSSCNYGFYEHQGLRRCGEKTFQVPIDVKNKMRFYLYEKELAN